MSKLAWDVTKSLANMADSSRKGYCQSQSVGADD